MQDRIDEPDCQPRDTPRRDFFRRTTSLVAGSALLSAADAGAADAPRGDASFTRRMLLRFKLNGQSMAADVEARTSLLDFLRERVDLPGTKKGCNEGACGACTVLLDGQRINACLTLAAQCEGREITTVEGLAAADGSLHPVQLAFIAHDAFQCGYCTPGQVVSAVACIREGHAGDAATVQEWMSGNLCRCAAYPQIAAAVLDAAKPSNGRAA